jgi:hypothetical protein
LPRSRRERGCYPRADGVSSTVAALVGAKRDRVMPTQTMLYYAYWIDADTRNTQDFFFEPPWICAHFPADDGHHVVTMNGSCSMTLRKRQKGRSTWFAGNKHTA